MGNTIYLQANALDVKLIFARSQLYLISLFFHFKSQQVNFVLPKKDDYKVHPL
jgi:hypothetical protein